MFNYPTAILVVSCVMITILRCIKIEDARPSFFWLPPITYKSTCLVVANLRPEKVILFLTHTSPLAYFPVAPPRSYPTPLHYYTLPRRGDTYARYFLLCCVCFLFPVLDAQQHHCSKKRIPSHHIISSTTFLVHISFCLIPFAPRF